MTEHLTGKAADDEVERLLEAGRKAGVIHSSPDSEPAPEDERDAENRKVIEGLRSIEPPGRNPAVDEVVKRAEDEIRLRAKARKLSKARR